MPVERLTRFLDENQVRYVVIRHSPAYTAQETAAAAHIPGHVLAKTVMVKINGEMAMIVLPATERLDLAGLRDAVGTDTVELVPEREFRDRFPDCEVGAMPPFGNLYGMQVYVSERLTEDEEIAFNAGSHRELIRLRYRDFARLVQPRLLPQAAVR